MHNPQSSSTYSEQAYYYYAMMESYLTALSMIVTAGSVDNGTAAALLREGGTLAGHMLMLSWNGFSNHGQFLPS